MVSLEDRIKFRHLIMESLCSEDQQENSTSYCICRFPLPSYCARHAEEHQTKKADFHFILPLTARNIITTKDVYYQVKSWLYQLNSKCDILHEKLTDLATWEEQLEAAYQECLQLAAQTKERYTQALAVRKTQLQTAVENAIKETRLHALETQNFVPVDSLSQLLWFQDPGSVSSFSLYSFQANCIKENFDTAFQVALSFNVPGFDQMNLAQMASPLEAQVEQLTKELRSKENKLEQEKQSNHALNSQIQTAAQQSSTKEFQMRTNLETRDQQIIKLNASIESLKQQVQHLTKPLNESKTANVVVAKRFSEHEASFRPLESQSTGLLCSICGKTLIYLFGVFSCGEKLCQVCVQTPVCPHDQAPNVSADPAVNQCLLKVKEACDSQISANVEQYLGWFQGYLHNTYHVQNTYPQFCPYCQSTPGQGSPAYEELPALRSSKDSGLVTDSPGPCPKCGFQYDNRYCRNCLYVNFDFLATLKIDLTIGAGMTPPVVAQTGYEPPNPCWTCPNCRYEYNTTATCQKCPNLQPSQSGGQSASPQYDAYSANLQQGGYNEAQPASTQCVQMTQYPNPQYSEQQGRQPAPSQGDQNYAYFGSLQQRDPSKLNVDQMVGTDIALPPVQKRYERPNPCWTCPNCRYEDNTNARCLQCRTAKPSK